jgi:hypothetical protein
MVQGKSYPPSPPAGRVICLRPEPFWLPGLRRASRVTRTASGPAMRSGDNPRSASSVMHVVAASWSIPLATRPDHSAPSAPGQPSSSRARFDEGVRVGGGGRMGVVALIIESAAVDRVYVRLLRVLRAGPSIRSYVSRACVSGWTRETRSDLGFTVSTRSLSAGFDKARVNDGWV